MLKALLATGVLLSAAIGLQPLVADNLQRPAPEPAPISDKSPAEPWRWVAPVPGELMRSFDPPPEPWLAGHRGIDLAAQPGQAVSAVADGVVSFAGQVAGRDVVSVQHGMLRSTYEPVSSIVNAGRQVRAGERIGSVHGAAHNGCSCLHLGALVGDDYVDPWPLLRRASRLSILETR